MLSIAIFETFENIETIATDIASWKLDAIFSDASSAQWKSHV